MVATRDMPGDLHVIGLVGQDETGGRVAFQQSSEDRGVGRVAANNTMRTELEPIANPGDRNGWIWVERPLLQSLGGVAENDVANLCWRETCDFDRRIDHDQSFELDFQRVEVPLTFFRETIDGKSEHPLLVLAQVLNADARDPIKS